MPFLHKKTKYDVLTKSFLLSNNRIFQAINQRSSHWLCWGTLTPKRWSWIVCRESNWNRNKTFPARCYAIHCLIFNLQIVCWFHPRDTDEALLSHILVFLTFNDFALHVRLYVRSLYCLSLNNANVTVRSCPSKTGDWGTLNPDYEPDNCKIIVLYLLAIQSKLTLSNTSNHIYSSVIYCDLFGSNATVDSTRQSGGKGSVSPPGAVNK